MSDPWNRCDVCGKFISMSDFPSPATRNLVYPDSELTKETWETFCKSCSEDAKPSQKSALQSAKDASILLRRRPSVRNVDAS
jgi:hypothetical protein